MPRGRPSPGPSGPPSSPSWSCRAAVSGESFEEHGDAGAGVVDEVLVQPGIDVLKSCELADVADRVGVEHAVDRPGPARGRRTPSTPRPVLDEHGGPGRKRGEPAAELGRHAAGLGPRCAEPPASARPGRATAPPTTHQPLALRPTGPDRVRSGSTSVTAATNSGAARIAPNGTIRLTRRTQPPASISWKQRRPRHRRLAGPSAAPSRRPSRRPGTRPGSRNDVAPPLRDHRRARADGELRGEQGGTHRGQAGGDDRQDRDGEEPQPAASPAEPPVDGDARRAVTTPTRTPAVQSPCAVAHTQVSGTSHHGGRPVRAARFQAATVTVNEDRLTTCGRADSDGPGGDDADRRPRPRPAAGHRVARHRKKTATMSTR